MIVHLDKLIRHLRSQIESADKVNSEFIYLTKREAEGCLELAEAQEVIQEMISDGCFVVHCKDCGNKKCWERTGNVVCGIDGNPHRPDWFCAYGVKKDAEM